MTAGRPLRYNRQGTTSGAEELIPMSGIEAPAPGLAAVAPAVAAGVHGVWAALAGALLALSAGTALAGLWPFYRQLSAPCGETGFCFTPALFAHDVAVLAQYGVSLTAYATLIFLLQIVVTICYLSLAGILFWRRRDDTMALCTVAVLAIQPLVVSGYLTALIDFAGPGRLLPYLTLLVGKIALILFLALFPSGSFVPRSLRRYLPWLIGLVVAGVVAEALNPLNPAVRVGVYIVETGWIVSMLLVQLYRYLRVSTPVERRQTRWLIALFSVYFSYSIGFTWYIGTVGSPDGRHTLIRVGLFVLGYLLELALVFAIVIGLRRGLYDLGRVVGRTMVYALLTVCVVALYVLFVGGVSVLLRPESNILVSLLATGVVAVAFQPLRAALQRGVNHLIYGRRDEPYHVLALLGQRLGGALAPQDMLPTVAATVRDALRLPYVAVTRADWGGETVVSVSGEPAGPTLALPLVFQGEPIGRLVAAQRAPEEPFTAHERRLLESLAQHISIAAHAVRLTDDLQRSRERLVTAREEERRRLQRDLHDELGPTLASMSMQLDAGRALLAEDPAAGEALLGEVQAQLRETIGSVRRLVHQLRPPILDQLGLRGSIREHALRVERGSGVRVSLDLPAALPPLSAAIEVAAYYIVVEALNNMARHACARRCTVQLRATDELLIEVVDDGVGLPAQPAVGVGLRSMRERALEVGGAWQAAPTHGGGVTVRAALPLARAAG
jgi:signal transduction histidine kinase